MIGNFLVWWHRKVLKHHQRRSRFAMSKMDTGKGIYVICWCGKQWSL